MRKKLALRRRVIARLCSANVISRFICYPALVNVQPVERNMVINYDDNDVRCGLFRGTGFRNGTQSLKIERDYAYVDSESVNSADIRWYKLNCLCRCEIFVMIYKFVITHGNFVVKSNFNIRIRAYILRLHSARN